MFGPKNDYSNWAVPVSRFYWDSGIYEFAVGWGDTWLGRRTQGMIYGILIRNS
jgi:hypothetical protein